MSDDIFLTPQIHTQIQPPQPQSLHEVTNFAETMDVTSFSQRGTYFQPNTYNDQRCAE